MSLSLELLRVLSQESDKLTSNKYYLKKFVRNFPFKDLLNLNAMHEDSSIYSLSLLESIASQSELYDNSESTGCILEYVTVIITTLNSFYDMYILAKSLDLMKILVKQLVMLPDLRAELLNIERIFEILIIASNSPACVTANADLSAEILEHLLRIQPVLTDAAHETVAIIFRKCCQLKAISGICALGRNILKRFDGLSVFFMSIYQWIADESCEYLKFESDPIIIKKLLRTLNQFISKYHRVYQTNEYYALYEKLFAKLKSKSSTICKYISSNQLRSQALLLLRFLIIEFHRETDIPLDEVTSLVKSEIGKLKHNPSKWPYVRSRIFFLICNLLYVHDELLWSSKEIIDAVERQLQIPEPFRFAVFKPLFFIYSVTVVDCMHPRKILVGDNLLKTMHVFSGYNQIYTFHEAQLVWILCRAASDFKVNALKQWMKNVNEDDKIISVIKYCNAGKLLIKILKQKSEENIMQRTSLLLRKLKDEELCIEVAAMLPLAISYPTLLKYLILSHPGIPRNKNEGIKLCSLLGSILPHIDNENVLKGVLVYSKRLLASLRHEPDSLREFCRRKTNIIYIIQLADKVDETTAMEVIRLLQLFIVIQEVNALPPIAYIEVDIAHLLSGSNKKIIKATQLFHQILTCKDSFLKFNFRSHKNLFNHLLRCGDDRKLADCIYKCLIVLVKTEPNLALTTMAYMHIGTYCEVPIDRKFAQIFLRYLICWIQAVSDSKWHHVMVSLKMVKKFLLSFSPGPKTKLQKYVKMLDEIPHDPLWN